jgi:uncharacterized protein
MWTLVALACAQDWGTRDWPGAIEALKRGEAFSHHYEPAETACPLCAAKIRVAKIGTYSTSGKDLDFKVARYVSANPYLFTLWMCPSCNYCANAGTFEAKIDVEKTRAALGAPKVYGSYFDIPYSVLLRRAEQCAVANGTADGPLGWLYLYGAWVARDSEAVEAEKDFHRKAREKFEIVAGAGEGNERAAAAYLVGEIHRRYGERDKAKAWLDRAEAVAAEVKSANIPSWIEACRKELEKK